MKYFLDTSVLVAAFWADHHNHSSSLQLVSSATPSNAFCAAHTLAEVYSTMTRLPVRPAILPEQALLFVKQIRDRFTIVSLTEEEYFAAIEAAAAKGLAKGLIYDALTLAAAAKSKAGRIYTWNLGDFARLAQPRLASRIRTPQLGA